MASGAGGIVAMGQVESEKQARTSFSEEKEAKRLFFTACVGDSFAKADRNQKFFGYFFSKKVTAFF
jgi:hypothetical protein